MNLPVLERKTQEMGYVQLILGVFLAVVFLFFGVFGFAYFFYRTSDGDMPDFKEELTASYEDPVVELKPSAEESQTMCDVKFIDPILPSENETQTALFTSDVATISGTLNRKILGGLVYVDVSVTGLDVEDNYVMHAVDVDDTNKVCYSSVMGELTFVETSDGFVSGMYKMDAAYVNDATLFVLVKDGYGLTGEVLDSLLHPSVVMMATFLPQ
ncbi:MAG: hypothetical protein RLY61_260 [Candidatus Parcubacteria bacterium]|jgi:hypothetical protein